METGNESSTLLTFDDILKKYPFTGGQLRSFLMKRHENGLDKSIRKIGKRIYFREVLFEEWIEKFTVSNGMD